MRIANILSKNRENLGKEPFPIECTVKLHFLISSEIKVEPRLLGMSLTLHLFGH